MLRRLPSHWCLAGTLIALSIHVTACDPALDDPDEIEPGPTEPLAPAGERLAAGLGVMSLATAVSPEGAGLVDNFLPCVHRGVIDYRNTPAGRQATFTGCDVGNGVVIDGAGEIQWVGPDLSPQREEIGRVLFAGSLAVTVDGGAPRTIESFEVVPTDLVSTRGEPFPDRLTLTSAEVTVDDETVVFTQAEIDAAFDISDLTIDTIANPSGTLTSFTEADGKRLAYHGAMLLFRMMVGESFESQRGNHSHELECGTTDVIYNAQDLRLSNRWDECADAGLVFTGDFTLDASRFDETTVGFILAGPLTLGGGVPRAVIEQMEFAVAFLDGGLPGRFRIAAEVQGLDDSLSLAFDLYLDD